MNKLLVAFFLIFAVSHAFAADLGEKAGSTAPDALLVGVADVNYDMFTPKAEYIGTVQYVTKSSIAAEYAGKIDAVYATAGDIVKKGDPLLGLNSDILQHSIVGAKANAAKAERDYQRAKSLYEKSATSLQNYQDSQTAYDLAVSELRILEEELRRAVVYAPFNGVILADYISVGEWVSVGTTIFDIASDRLEVVANIPEIAARHVALGGSVSVNNSNGVTEAGAIRAFVPQANLNTRLFPLYIDLPTGSKMLSGADVKLSLPIGDGQEAAFIPRDAITTRDSRNLIVFAVLDGVAKEMAVDVLGYVGNMAAVLTKERLSMVVTSGNDRVRNSQSVTYYSNSPVAVK